MADEQRQQSEQHQVESSVLKLQEEFHQFLHECQECQREIEPHWQVCAHCGGTIGDALPRLRQSAPTGRRAGLPAVRVDTPAGPAVRRRPPGEGSGLVHAEVRSSLRNSPAFQN